jgi:hypothetical protein
MVSNFWSYEIFFSYLDTLAHFIDDEYVWNRDTLTQSIGLLTHHRKE